MGYKAAGQGGLTLFFETAVGTRLRSGFPIFQLGSFLTDPRFNRPAPISGSALARAQLSSVFVWRRF
jgi:hypothetical protein